MEKIEEIKELRETVEGYLERDFKEDNQLKEILFGEKITEKSKAFIENLRPYRTNLLTKVLIGEMKVEEANEKIAKNMTERIEELKLLGEKLKKKPPFFSRILGTYAKEIFSLWLSANVKIIEGSIDGINFIFSEKIVEEAKKIIENTIEVSKEKRISPKTILASDNYYSEIIKKIYSREQFKEKLKQEINEFLKFLISAKEKLVDSYIEWAFSKSEKKPTKEEKTKFQKFLFKTLERWEKSFKFKLNTLTNKIMSIFPIAPFIFIKTSRESPELRGKNAFEKLKELKKKAEEAKNNIELYVNIKTEEIFGK